VKDFHRQCDNKGATVTVIEDIGGYVFGGFTEKSWTSLEDNFKRADKAFLFSLHNHGGSGAVKMMVEGSEKKYAMLDHPEFGPSFGGICVRDQANTKNNSFSNMHKWPLGVDSKFFTGSKHFLAAEVEVFRFSPASMASSTRKSNGKGAVRKISSPATSESPIASRTRGSRRKRRMISFASKDAYQQQFLFVASVIE